MTTFTTTEYEFSHGHKPRGTGRWAFVIAWKRTAETGRIQTCEEMMFFTGTLTETKKKASEYGRTMARLMSAQVDEIRILP